MKIHHIGIGVKNLDASVRFYQDALGLEEVDYIDWPELGLRAAVIPIGDTVLELIEPVSPEGAVAKDLAEGVSERGNGVHHLAFEVDDIEAAVRKLRAGKFEMMSEAPQSTKGGRLAWLRRCEAPGAMIELVEAGYRIV